MGRKAISITEAKKLFPDFKLGWKIQHPECKDPKSVGLGHPKFGTFRRMVIVETDKNGKPIKPLWDQPQLEEGPVDSDRPGTIVVPWFENNGVISVVMRREQRGVRQTNALEFPQGGVEGDETVMQTGIRELKEETGLEVINNNIVELQEVCAEPDWFPRGTKIVAAQVPVTLPSHKNNLYPYSVDNLFFLKEVDSSTSVAALTRFLHWLWKENAIEIVFSK